MNLKIALPVLLAIAYFLVSTMCQIAPAVVMCRWHWHPPTPAKTPVRSPRAGGGCVLDRLFG